jgi:glycosyltransferase involved in cell wall biosynthesis
VTNPSARPTISCIVPTFEDAGLARRCLLSILGQSLEGIEVVVVDDSTTAAVSRVVDELGEDGRPIAYVEGARTGNPVDNWNLGLARAHGTWTLLVHHDEYLLDASFLARATRRLSVTPGRALLAGSVFLGPKGGRFRLVSCAARLLRPPPWTLYLTNWAGPTAALVFPTDAGLRFDRRLSWTVDVDFYARLWRETGPFLRESSACVASTPHAGQITARMDTIARHREELDRLARARGGPLAPWQVALGRISLDLKTGFRVLGSGDKTLGRT